MTRDEAEAPEQDAPPCHGPDSPEALRRAAASRRRRLIRRKEIAHKITFLDDLLFNLDLLFTAQIAVCYYLE